VRDRSWWRGPAVKKQKKQPKNLKHKNIWSCGYEWTWKVIKSVIRSERSFYEMDLIILWALFITDYADVRLNPRQLHSVGPDPAHIWNGWNPHVPEVARNWAGTILLSREDLCTVMESARWGEGTLQVDFLQV